MLAKFYYYFHIFIRHVPNRLKIENSCVQEVMVYGLEESQYIGDAAIGLNALPYRQMLEGAFAEYTRSVMILWYF